MIFNFYSDPSHGWVKIPKELLKKLNLENEISHYSYVRDAFVYLEEDKDLTTFVRAMEKKGKEVKFRQFHGNKSSKIRNYERYEKDLKNEIEIKKQEHQEKIKKIHLLLVNGQKDEMVKEIKEFDFFWYHYREYLNTLYIRRKDAFRYFSDAVLYYHRFIN